VNFHLIVLVFSEPNSSVIEVIHIRFIIIEGEGEQFFLFWGKEGVKIENYIMTKQIKGKQIGE